MQAIKEKEGGSRKVAPLDNNRKNRKYRTGSAHLSDATISRSGDIRWSKDRIVDRSPQDFFNDTLFVVSSYWRNSRYYHL